MYLRQIIILYHAFFSYDYVALYDGPNNTSPLITLNCDQTVPDPSTFLSTGNQMYVRLKADGSVATKGFKANYTWVTALCITPPLVLSHFNLHNMA